MERVGFQNLFFSELFHEGRNIIFSTRASPCRDPPAELRRLKCHAAPPTFYTSCLPSSIPPSSIIPCFQFKNFFHFGNPASLPIMLSCSSRFTSCVCSPMSPQFLQTHFFFILQQSQNTKLAPDHEEDGKRFLLKSLLSVLTSIVLSYPVAIVVRNPLTTCLKFNSRNVGDLKHKGEVSMRLYMNLFML